MLKSLMAAIIGWIFVTNFCNEIVFAQGSRSLGEVIVYAEGVDSIYTISISGSTQSGKTRWDFYDTDALPTSSYGNIYDSCPGDEQCGFDAADSKTCDWPDMAWALYNMSFNCGTFSRNFRIDFRDRDWKSGYWDLHIKYIKSEGKLKYKDGYDNWYDINNNDDLDIWTIFDDPSPNKTALLVPVTATNNFSGGQIEMDGGSYGTPKTCNWGWTTSHTIAAVTLQYVGGKTYSFRKWSDDYSQTNRSLQIDDQHDSYSFTANFWNAYISGPSSLDAYQVGTFTAQPSGGVPLYDYTWYRMEMCLDPERQLGGGGTRRPPCDV